MSYPETKFVAAPKLVVASLERRGAHSGIDSKGIEQAGYPFCLYFDNPSETPEDNLRSEACIPVRKQFQPQGEFLMKEVGEAQVAETRHPGPPEDFGKTYGPFLEGLLRDGYKPVGPPREYYTTVSDVKWPGSGFLIQQPIARG